MQTLGRPCIYSMFAYLNASTFILDLATNIFFSLLKKTVVSRYFSSCGLIHCTLVGRGPQFSVPIVLSCYVQLVLEVLLRGQSRVTFRDRVFSIRVFALDGILSATCFAVHYIYRRNDTSWTKWRNQVCHMRFRNIDLDQGATNCTSRIRSEAARSLVVTWIIDGSAAEHRSLTSRNWRRPGNRLWSQTRTF